MMPAELILEAAPIAAKKRRFRFSLQSLMTLVVVLAVPLGWIAKERRQSQNEWQIAEQLCTDGVSGIRFGGPYDSLELFWQSKPQGWWRDFAEQILGSRVIALEDAATDFSDISSLSGLTNLQCLVLQDSQVSDLTPLSGLTKLRLLNLCFTEVDNLTPVSTLNNLKGLYLIGTPVRDVTPLSGLMQLRELNLRESQASHDQISKLRKTLPNCTIK